MNKRVSSYMMLIFSKSRESKYSNIIDLYYHIERLISSGIQNIPRGGFQQDVILQRINELESNYDAFINAILGIEMEEEENNVEEAWDAHSVGDTAK
jgi:hypothetical protein